MAVKAVSKSDNGNALVTREQMREISRNERFSDANLRQITTMEQAIAAAREVYGDVLNVGDHLGTGFSVLDREEKMKLVDVPFFILHMSFNEGDHGEEGFVSLTIMTGDDKRFVINDGSSGIRSQCEELVTENQGRFGGYMVHGGLRMSEYTTCTSCEMPRKESSKECSNILSNGSQCGDTKTARGKGETFYLDTTIPQ